MDCDIDLYSIFGCSARAKSIRGSKFLPPDWTNFGAFNFLPTHWRSLCTKNHFNSFISRPQRRTEFCTHSVRDYHRFTLCALTRLYIIHRCLLYIFIYHFLFRFFFFDPLADRPSFSVTIANLSMSLEFAYGYYCYRISNCFRSISQEPSAEKTDNCTKLN